MNKSALASLTALLWQERQQLERLLFALISQQLVLRAGQSRWLSFTDHDIEKAAAAIRDSEVLRALEIHEITAQLGVAEDISLAELAEKVDEPWRQALTDHRSVLRGLAAEIDAARIENQRLLTAGAQAIATTLDRLGGFGATYDARGGGVRESGGPTFLDEQA